MKIPSADLTPIPEYAFVMPVKEWLDAVSVHAFIDYDGHGYWATETHQFCKLALDGLISSSYVIPSHITKKGIKPPAWATHVAWYNK